MRIGKPNATLDLIELSDWCRNQYKNAKYPCDSAHRFLIGNYQVLQGIEWKNNDSSDESYVAACIHWIMVAEMLNVHMETYLPLNIFKGGALMTSEHEYIVAQAKASQMIIYGEAGQKTKRGLSRYKPDVLGESLAIMINHCMRKVNVPNVKKSMQLAMEIMTGVL